MIDSEFLCFVGDHEFRKGIHRHIVSADSAEDAARAVRDLCSQHDAETVEVFVHVGRRFATELVELS